MRPRLLLFFLLCLQIMAPAQDALETSHAAWTHEQKVRVMQPGLARLELEPALLDAAQATSGAPFHDLRLVSPTGVETPYLLTLPQLKRAPRVDAADFKVTLHPDATVLQFRQAGADMIREVLLETTAPSFIKAATLAASNDGVTWETLGSGVVLARQNGSERLRIPLSPAAWTHFRVTIDDNRSAPVVFDGAQLSRDLPGLHTLPHAATIRSRKEAGQETHLTLDLGTANLFLDSVRVRTPEPVFQREAALLGTRRVLFRLKHDGHTGEELEIPVQQIATKREVELVIRNGDSPPLAIEGVDILRHAIPLVFQADMAGEWRLFIGNAQATEPQYDIAAFSDRLRDAATRPATASAVEANPAFRKAATGPATGDETGAALDVSTWAWRRPVQFAEAGVVELELGPEVLANATSDLHDLRVVRDGHQVPFLVIKPGSQRETEVSFKGVIDEQAPTRSAWDVALPFQGFPASEVVLETSNLLFERQLEVVEYRNTEQGRATRTLGTAVWRRTPELTARPLVMGLYQAPQTSTVQIRTENGDNPPLRLVSVRLLHPVVRLLFRVPDTAPVHLCYGRPQAPYARYDLQLVRHELETSTKVAATLGGEEKLPGFHNEPAPSTQSAGAGSAWVWAALAVVVIGLLVVIAKLLPKT